MCTSLVGYPGEVPAGGKPTRLAYRLAQLTMPTRHLVGDCPLASVDEAATPRKYTTLQHFVQGMARRKEEKLANMVAHTRRRELASQQKNATTRKSAGYFARDKGGQAAFLRNR